MSSGLTPYFIRAVFSCSDSQFLPKQHGTPWLGWASFTNPGLCVTYFPSFMWERPVNSWMSSGAHFLSFTCCSVSGIFVFIHQYLGHINQCCFALSSLWPYRIAYPYAPRLSVSIRSFSAFVNMIGCRFTFAGQVLEYALNWPSFLDNIISGSNLRILL